MSGIEKRGKGKLGSSGPFLAEVTNHLDPEVMGSLEVALIKLMPNSTKIRGDVYPVRYLSPFYGVTNKRFTGANADKFDDTQKSYGMWMVPPDIGTTVLVIFVDGDPNQGYWIGCVQDRYQNFMVPGLAASENVHISQDDAKKYNFGDKVTKLPVAEFNTNNVDLNDPSIATLKKPIHPFTDRLVQQGLLKDPIRGTTTSSARRERPSQVFGISTPGPLDVNGRKQQIGYDKKREVPVSRLGGSTFVMDDGDINGDNELVRIRTRTGHQILLHNTKDLIYIANSKGTAWIELTSNGKIDIFAQDSVSIHTENDFNFRADRDINFEAGRNFNLIAYGNIDVNATGSVSLISNKDGKLEFANNFNLTSNSDIKVTSSGVTNFKAEGALRINSGGNTEIASSANVLIKGTKIHLNGSSATGTPADSAEKPTSLPTYSLPATKFVEGDWGNKKYYKATDLISILKRVPMHEPWEHHESVDEEQFTPDATDNTSSGGAATTSTVTYTKQPNVAGIPPETTGNVESDNVNAFLWMIRVCEGTSGSNGYRTQYTGVLFDSYADHPRTAITAPIAGRNITSTAAGAYQFLTTTWDQCKKALNLKDFSPANQDKAAIYLIQTAGALSDVKAGNFKSAIAKTNRIWASLPNSPYNQNPKSYGTALAYYKQAGGTVVA